MDSSYGVDEIDIDALHKLIEGYPDTVPEKLASLDQQRYDVIPHALKEREGTPSLNKSEVAILVDWKVSHGKFRPSLKGLFQQNTEQAILDVTKDGFSCFSRSAESAKAAVNCLTKLRGIGPATASLLLSVYDPHTAPFFSDELFRWCMWETGKGQGWDRDIKYTMKEYLHLFNKVQELRTRLNKQSQANVGAADFEKAAYVLGKRALIATENESDVTLHPGKKRKAKSNDSDPPRQPGSDGLSSSKKPKTQPSSRTRSSKSAARAVSTYNPSGSKS